MTDTQHPITPPAELVQEWWNKVALQASDSGEANQLLCIRAAQWGADQELEACCEWLGAGKRENLAQVVALRAARRPKPPSLKEKALDALKTIEREHVFGTITDTIRRALEQLDG